MIRVVTPFRPFPPVSLEHRQLGPFDWLGAITMLRASVERSCRCETVAITDVDTDLPGPAFQYVTHERQLMLWILEVALRYLSGPHFDRDTAMVSPDCLVYCDLRPWFAGDFGIVIRPDHERPILNSVQWWPVAAKDRLIGLYEEALDIARRLPADVKTWGADSEPFRQLLAPLVGGCGPRACGIVANLIDHRHVLHALTGRMERALDAGEPVTAPQAVLDFRYLRKHYMRAYFDATIGPEALA